MAARPHTQPVSSRAQREGGAEGATVIVEHGGAVGGAVEEPFGEGEFHFAAGVGIGV